MPKPPLTNEQRQAASPRHRGLELVTENMLFAGGAGTPLSPMPLFASSSPPGRINAVGPGSAGMGGDPRQLTNEDMSLIVAGTSLQTGEPSQTPSFKSSELQNALSGSLDPSNPSRSIRPDEGGQDGEGQGCFHVRHVEVTELLEDNTLGLLLHGTSVVGFCSSRAEQAGWRVADQIVEVNCQRVGSFDEFLECFVAAQSQHGLPIDFSVLRREVPAPGEPVEAEDALENFFSSTNFVDLAGELQRKFGSGERGPGPGNEEYGGQLMRPEAISILENPYIQALNRRRDELLMNTESWNGTIGTPHSASIASRLATRQDAGLATLEDPFADSRDGPLKPCGFPFCAPIRAMGCREAAPMNEVQHTPRMDQFEAFDERFEAGHCEDRGFERRLDENSNTRAISFEASETTASSLISAPCVESGNLSSAAAPVAGGVTDSNTLCDPGKENSVNSLEPEMTKDKNMDASSFDGCKSADAETGCVASRQNFAARLLPIGNAR